MKLYKNTTFLIAVLLLILWVYKPWFLSPILSAGDLWYYFPSMYDNFYLYPQAWYTRVLYNGLGGAGYVFQNGNILASSTFLLPKVFNINWETSVKLVFFLPFLLISISSSSILFRKLFPKNKFWFLAPLIFSLNTYILMIASGGQMLISLSYSLIPITLYFFIKLSEKANSDKYEISKYVIVSILLIAMQSLLDLRIAFVTAIAILIYLLFVFWDKGMNIGLRVLIIYLVSFIILAILNSYWLIPVLLLGLDPIKGLGIDYGSSGIVEFLSFAKIENSIGLLHPNWPENIFGKVDFMRPEFLLLPILAFSSLLFISRKEKTTKYILAFATIGLVGIFLGKGANEPFGGIYIWLFENVPGFQMFRDSFKWYVLIILSFIILIPFTLGKISDYLNKRFKLKYTYLIVFALFLAYFLFLIRPAMLGNLTGTFQNRDAPNSYLQLNNFLSEDNSFFRTLWIPSTTLFGHYTNQHPQLTGSEFFDEFNQKDLVSKISLPSSQKVLEEASVKYIIVPEDTEKLIYLTEREYDESKYQEIVNSVDEINWLEKVNQFGKIVVYKTPSYKEHFWCDCEVDISYEFINPTKYFVNIKNAKVGDMLVFSESFDENWVARNDNFNIRSQKYNNLYNSFILSDGDYEIEVYYVPQKYVELGIKISLATIGFLIIILAVSLVKKHKK